MNCTRCSVCSAPLKELGHFYQGASLSALSSVASCSMASAQNIRPVTTKARRAANLPKRTPQVPFKGSGEQDGGPGAFCPSAGGVCWHGALRALFCRGHHAKASCSSPPSFCHWQAQGAVSNLGDMELWRCPVSVSMHVWGE